MFRIGLKFALLAAFALPAYSGMIVPPALWGGGVGQVSANVPNFHGSTYCLLNTSVTSCAVNVASNLTPQFPDYNVGTAASTGSAWVDANGAHLTLTASSSGEGNVDSKATAGLSDTLYNHTSGSEMYQITFHVDASFFALSSASESFSVNSSNVPLYQQSQSGGGAGTYAYLDQDFTITGTVAANSYANWEIDMSGEVIESTAAGLTYLGGLPRSTIDAGNTLSLSTYIVTDAGGNPVSATDASSYYGFGLNQTPGVPEPSTPGLFLGGAIFLSLAEKKRKVASRKRAGVSL